MSKTSRTQDIRITILHKQNQELMNRLLNMETRSMRDNLLFSGIPEAEYETEADIRSALDKLFSEMDLTGIEVIRCHRIGHNKKRIRPRTIVGVFDWQHKQLIMRNGKKLKGLDPKIYINEQYAAEIDNRRAILRPILKIAKQQNMKAVLSRDRLILDGKPYTVDDLDKIPIPLDILQKACIIRNDHYVFYYGRLAPYSNFLACDITIDHTKYCCVEQYFQHCKAMHSNEFYKAEEIMMTSNPAIMKAIGGSISAPSSWETMQLDVMEQGVMAKFEQNHSLRLQLLATGEARLVEASLYDMYWGIGKGLRGDDLEKPSTWKGKNHMGHILEAVRRDLG